MSLIGNFTDTGSIYDDSNTYYFPDQSTPVELALGIFPAGHFVEEFKCTVINPAPAGTTFKLLDQADAEIVPTKKIFPDRQGTFTVNNIGIISAEKELTGKLEGSAGTCSLLFIKKIVRIS